jgi:hypothetical protein
MEDFGAAYLQQRMRRSQHKLVRWLAPAAPLTLISIHLEQGIGVVAASTHPCSALGPGYIAVGELDGHETCSSPPPSPAAAQPQVNAQSKNLRPR